MFSEMLNQRKKENSKIIKKITKRENTIKKRREAKERGDSIYIGSQCSICGNTERYTSTTHCVACKARRQREYLEKSK